MVDREALARALMDIGPPAMGDGGQFSAGTPIGNKAAMVASQLGYGAMSGLATLPQRAIQNSQYSLDSGNYDPAPTMEAAMLPMGTGAIAGVPVQAGEQVLGSGMARMRMIENADLLKELANQRRSKGLSVGKQAPGWDFKRPEAEKGSWQDLVARTKAQWELDKMRAVRGFEDVAPNSIPKSSLMSAEDYAFIAKNGGLSLAAAPIVKKIYDGSNEQ